MSADKYPRYEAQKDSGVEWLGQVPAHWGVRSLKHIARLQTGMTPPTEEVDNYTDDEGYQWIRPEDLDESGIPTKSSKFLTAKGWSKIRPIKAGASLVCCIGTIGKVGITSEISSTNQQITAAEPLQDARYLFYALCAGRSELELTSTGNVLRILNTERLGNIKFPSLPVPEQAQIASYLDRETAKIDTLIAKQERLIELLTEKRQAVITQAVTKGLNPSVPMKDSGVEWLGMVPAHWSVKAIKRATSVQRGASPRPIDDPIYFDSDGEYAWVRISDVTAAGMHLQETEQRLSDLGSSRSVKMLPGQLFLSIAGSVGKACITNVKCCIHDGFVYFPKWKGNVKFLYYIFASGAPYKGLGKLGTQLNLNTDTVGSISIGMPSVDEQLAIATFLDRETAKIDSTIEKSKRASELQKEHRASHISAAVTGKIDVRGLA